MPSLPALAAAALPLAALAAEPYRPTTSIRIAGGSWELNGKRTYPDARASGLLLNVRMVNATFEDRNPETCPKGFDPEANAEAFIRKVPEYVAHGVRAFTLSFQGGDPGYEGALNSGYDPDGSLRPAYAARMARAIEACDRAGACVILSCFYQRQDQHLRDAAAVRNAARATAKWVRDRGYTNVLLEIANEHAHGGFNHRLIKEPAGIEELIRIAREATPGLLVSASGMGSGGLDQQVGTAADFILIHFNSTPLKEIPERVAAARRSGKAVVCNEDDRTGAAGAQALQLAVDAVCSWGYMNLKRNQHYPFRFEGAADDPAVYAKFKELAAPGK